MHYKYYYYSREQLFERPVVTIAREALLMAMIMSALCKHTQAYIGGFIGNKRGQIRMYNLDVICGKIATPLDV